MEWVTNWDKREDFINELCNLYKKYGVIMSVYDDFDYRIENIFGDYDLEDIRNASVHLTHLPEPLKE